MARDPINEIARLSNEIKQIKKGQRYAHGGSIENNALEVKDGNGSLRAILGVQGDGTTAVNIVNGTPPPAPSAPVLAAAFGGVTAGWDGTFAGGVVIPLDWARVEVHASIVSGFTPVPATLVTTIETAQGGTVIVPCDTPVYVRLVARNTSGAASDPSAQAGPVGPAPVVADDILDGIVTTVKLAEDAVTSAKIAAGAVDTVALADSAVLAEKLADNAVKVGKIAQGAVTMNTLGGALGDTASQRYADYFRDATAWAQLSATGGGTWTINTTPAGTPSGGGRLIATGDVQVASKTLIPQDSDTLYRVMVRVRATAQDPSGVGTVYLGVIGVAEDGVTLVNRNGANSATTQYYCCTAGGSLGTADGWRTYTGWIQGHAATGAVPPAGPATDPRLPELTHANVRYLRPMLWLNFGKATSAVMEVEAVTVEAVRTGVVGSTNLITGSVTAGAIATDAVTAGKIAADAVTAREIAAGSVTASEVAAGAITTDKLTVTGGANVLTDPSFEGAYTASVIAGVSYASQDTTKGNGSPTSLKIDAAAGSPTNRSVSITAIPVLPGEQLNIGIDYWVANAWAGTAVNVHVRWETAAGAIVSYGIATSGASPVREAWTRLTGTYTAPATAAVARFRIESSGGTAGAVWFDNAALRPVLGGTQIQDGAVTTQKVVAGAIQTAQLDAGAVNADKIAAGAVTTTKLDALAVTSDKIAANAITAGKILAGSVDATALAADAITGKTITGGTITGALIQTATSGQRITLNEGGENMVLVYNDTRPTAIGELSERGLLTQGVNGAVMWLDPNGTYPALKFTNAAQTNTAFVQVVDADPTSADLGLYSGVFNDTDATVRRWRTYFGDDFWAAERVANTDLSNYKGGRVALDDTRGTVGYMNSADETKNTYMSFITGVAKLVKGRLELFVPPSTDPALYVGTDAGYTGQLLRINNGGSDKVTVDKDGNTTIAGTLTVTGRVKPATGEIGTVSLQNGWTAYDSTNYGTPTIRKSADGLVYLFGRIQAGTTANTTIVATIPSTYWPPVRHAFPHRAPLPNVDVTLLINEVGELRIYDISGTITNLSLSGIVWPMF